MIKIPPFVEVKSQKNIIEALEFTNLVHESFYNWAR